MASNIPDDGKTCTVCFETYSKPKFLKCGHTFCEKCIHKYVMKTKEKGTLENGIECPLCRTVTIVQSDRNRPDTWAKSLCSNFALENILAASLEIEVCKEKKDRSNDLECPFVCQPCLEQGNHLAASVFCTNCGQYQCGECAKLHNKFAVMKDHELIDIDGKEEKLKFLSSLKQMQFCDKHHETILYLCSSHKQLCCSTCVIEKHKHCKTAKIEDAAKSNSLEKMKESMKDLNVRIKSAAKFWSTRNDFIENQAETLQTEIEARREEVMKMFDTLKNTTISFLQRASRERIPEYSSNRESCEKLAADIDETLNLCDSAMTYGTSSQKYIVARYLEDRFVKYNTNSADEFSKLKSTKVMINYLPIGEQTQNAGEELGSPFLYSEKINVDDIPDCRECSLTLKFSAKVNSDSWYRSIDYLSDGRLVAVDHFKKKLILFDRELKFISEQGLEVSPFSVKTGSNDAILVTSGEAKQLFYFEVKSDDILHQVSSIKTEVRCDSIASFDEKSFFVGLFGGRKPLGMISDNGDEKTVSVDLPEKQYTAENSKCTFGSNSEKLAISDKNMDSIYIVDSKNNKKINIRSESIMQPRGIVFGPNDILFICSGGTDSIVQATTEGKILTSHKLNVSHPYAICISRDNSQLAIANMEMNDRQLQVFDIVSAKC